MSTYSVHLVPAFLLSVFSSTAFWMSVAGILIFLIGLRGAQSDIAHAHGLEKIVALANLCFAMPLAAFGAEHFTSARFIAQLVPTYMPGRLFWAYFVGVALVAAALSIATKIQVRWSGLLFGTMMFLFVAMMDLPGTLANVHNRISWTLLCREMSFGAGGCMVSAAAIGDPQRQSRRVLVAVGRLIIAVAAVFYGVEHLLHPTNVPGVPLERLMPVWIPGRALISYLTGAILIGGGGLILIGKKTRMAACSLGAWILLLVVFVYGPILIAAMLNPDTGVKVEGLNYFFDTLLYAGTTLALAKAAPHDV